MVSNVKREYRAKHAYKENDRRKPQKLKIVEFYTFFKEEDPHP